MHTWYKGRTIASIVHALRDVREYKQAKKKYLRWLQAGRVVFSVDSNERTSSWPISASESAIAVGAELAVFSGRRLRGLQNEQEDDFWNMDWSVSVSDKLKHDSEYFRCYQGFERYDQYFVIDGKSELMGGVGMWLEDSLQMMREVLVQPWTMRIENHTEESVAKDATKCILKGIDGPELNLSGDAWALSISYE